MRQSQFELEALIASSAPMPSASEGLKRQILQEARRSEQRTHAQRQFIAAVASCLLLFVLTEASLHSVSGASQTIATGLTIQTKPIEFCQLELTGEEIGSWRHVDAMLTHQSRISKAFRSASLVASTASF